LLTLTPIRLVVAAFVLSTASCLLAQSADLDGIAHVALRVADLERSRQFYGSLGFEKAFEFSELGNPTELFMKINDRQFIELYPRAQDSQPIGLMHVCYEVHDIESLRRAYVKLGLNTPEAKKFRAGNLLFVLRDPEGQIVEFTQYLPGSLHTDDKGKHLGDHRLSNRLQAAVAPVKNVDLEHAFYSNKLGFKPIATDRNRLRLPGDSGDELGLVPQPAPARLIFSVELDASTVESLKQRGLVPRSESGSVSVTDPDGTLIVFRAMHKHAKL
jgi:catechol 2,3-dioxygenase-like lactoylglutathione lyase family enzyme